MKIEAVLSFVMVMSIYRNRRTIVSTLTWRSDNFTFQMLINFESTPFSPNEGWCRRRRLTKGAHGRPVTIRRKIPLPTSQSILWRFINLTGRQGEGPSFVINLTGHKCAYMLRYWWHCSSHTDRLSIIRIPTSGSKSAVRRSGVRLGSHWQLNCRGGATVVVTVRALQLNSCLYWRHFSFSTEWISQRQHVCVCALLLRIKSERVFRKVFSQNTSLRHKGQFAGSLVKCNICFLSSRTFISWK